MFPDFKQYPYVLPGYRYNSLANLQATLEEKVIKPAEEKAKELEKRPWNGSWHDASPQPSPLHGEGAEGEARPKEVPWSGTNDGA